MTTELERSRKTAVVATLAAMVIACQGSRGEAVAVGPVLVGESGLIELEARPLRAGLRLAVELVVVHTVAGTPPALVHSSRRLDEVVGVKPPKSKSVYERIEPELPTAVRPRPGTPYDIEWSSPQPTFSANAGSIHGKLEAFLAVPSLQLLAPTG